MSDKADMATNVDDIVSLGKSTEDDTELKDNYEDVIQTDLGNNDEKPDVVDVDNIESSSGSDDIDLTGIPYLPEVGEFIVATADFQAFVPGGRPRNIKLNMQMKVRKFNEKGDALVDSHVYSELLITILKSDFNKIEHSQNRTLTEIFVEPEPNGRQSRLSLRDVVLEPPVDSTEEIISGLLSTETETIEEIELHQPKFEEQMEMLKYGPEIVSQLMSEIIEGIVSERKSKIISGLPSTETETIEEIELHQPKFEEQMEMLTCGPEIVSQLLSEIIEGIVSERKSTTSVSSLSTKKKKKKKKKKTGKKKKLFNNSMKNHILRKSILTRTRRKNIRVKINSSRKNSIDVCKINNIHCIVAKMINQQWREHIYGKKN